MPNFETLYKEAESRGWKIGLSVSSPPIKEIGNDRHSTLDALFVRPPNDKKVTARVATIYVLDRSLDVVAESVLSSLSEHGKL